MEDVHTDCIVQKARRALMRRFDLIPYTAAGWQRQVSGPMRIAGVGQDGCQIAHLGVLDDGWGGSGLTGRSCCGLEQRCAWWRKRGGRIILAKLHERLPETWNRFTATTQPRNAPETTRCWSPMRINSFLAIFILVILYRQLSAFPYSAHKASTTRLTDIYNTWTWAIFPNVTKTETYGCRRVSLQ
jgi:hypothetical protein